MEEVKLAYNVSEVCRLIGVSEPSLYLAIKNGEVPVVRIGRRMLIPKGWLDSMRNPSATAGQPSSVITCQERG